MQCPFDVWPKLRAPKEWDFWWCLFLIFSGPRCVSDEGNLRQASAFLGLTQHTGGASVCVRIPDPQPPPPPCSCFVSARRLRLTAVFSGFFLTAERTSNPQLLMPLMGSEDIKSMLKFACTLCSGALL